MATLTMLTEIMGADTPLAFARLRDLAIDELDLKGDVFGRQIEDLDDSRRVHLAELLNSSGALVHCFSSSLGGENVAVVPEREFRGCLERGVENLLATLPYVRPRLVRLLGCGVGEAQGDPLESLDSLAPWIFDAYREAAEALAGAGVSVTLENEPESVLSDPDAVPAFFARLGLSGKLGYTWDVQNMWAAGRFPSVAIYEQLRPLITYVHLKGGRGSTASPRTLAHRATLQEAGWPVQDIVSRVLRDGVSPVLCINISDGAIPDDYEHGHEDPIEMGAAEAVQDVRYLRRTFSAIA